MLKIMIIEDEPMVRKINEMYIDKLDKFEIVSSVADINEAKEDLLKNEVDLILLDVYLPSGSGLDLLKWIREKNFKSDVILITAENTIDSINKAFRYGVIDYLVKPFTFERFQESLNKFIERFNKMRINDKLEQSLIDKYITGIGIDNNKERVLRRGLNVNTYNEIINFIDSTEDECTAEFIATNIGLARVTVRRYLDYMVNEKEVKLIRTYGKVGRPTHFYKRI